MYTQTARFEERLGMERCSSEGGERMETGSRLWANRSSYRSSNRVHV